MQATTPEKTVETVIVQQPESRAGWQTSAYQEIRNGAWAVLLVGVVAYTAFKGAISKYMDKHLSLLDTMKDSLSKNAASLGSLAQTEQEQSESLKLQGVVLQQQGEAIVAQHNALITIDQRQKENVTKAMEMLNATATNISQMSGDHDNIQLRIQELKDLAEQNQIELIDKLQTIEDLYRASEVVTGNKGTLKNFWRK